MRMHPLFPLPNPTESILPTDVQRALCECGATIHVYPFALHASCNSCRAVYRVRSDMTLEAHR